MNERRMVIVTGLSGSGRSAALKAFEDMGYYCVDNLPLVLLPDFADFAGGSAEATRSAIGIDIREKDFPVRFPSLYREIKAGGHVIETLFLDASDQTLVRRFSETRRPHPLARGATALIDGIRKERAELGEVKTLADQIIDTSDFTVHDLRQAIERKYARGDAGRPLVITLISFGYKYGVPYDMDLMFDLRFLPNPHFVPELKEQTGEDPGVREYVMTGKDSAEFLRRLQDFLTYLLPQFRREGKSYLTIAFGCTGGRHRSVAVAVSMAERLREIGYEVILKHRDMRES